MEKFSASKGIYGRLNHHKNVGTKLVCGLEPDPRGAGQGRQDQDNRRSDKREPLRRARKMDGPILEEMTTVKLFTKKLDKKLIWSNGLNFLERAACQINRHLYQYVVEKLHSMLILLKLQRSRRNPVFQ